MPTEPELSTVIAGKSRKPNPIPIMGLHGEVLGNLNPSDSMRAYLDHGGQLDLSTATAFAPGRGGRMRRKCVELTVLVPPATPKGNQ